MLVIAFRYRAFYPPARMGMGWGEGGGGYFPSNRLM